MKKIVLAAIFCFAYSIAFNQKVISLYDGAAPGSESWNWEGKEITSPRGDLTSYNISKPTLEVFQPEAGKANGTAVIIAPGGGFYFQSMTSEGRDVAKWLVNKGITCFILKYRLVHILSDDPRGELGRKIGTQDFLNETSKVIPLSVADGKQAISWVRKHAGEWGVNSGRIGIMGFSAGGTVAASALFNYDAANKPNFAATIYPYFPDKMIGKVNASAPPLFIAVASDDNLNLATHSAALYNKWLEARVPVEMHAYAKGYHGFGMQKQNLPSDSWIERFSDWLNMQGLLTAENTAFKDYEKKEFILATYKVLPYRIMYPRNFDKNKKYPLVIFLHGSGERGNDNEKQLMHGGALFAQAETKYPAIVVFPQCPENISWNSMVVDRTKNPPVRELNYNSPEPWPLTATYNLVNQLVKSGNADAKKIYISGLSMGGFGTFEMVYRHPQLFAAAMPICGGADTDSYDGSVKKIPFWVFHGDADQSVDVKLSREAVAKLKQIGAKVKYTEYPGVGHNSWDNAFAEPDFVKWMFDQKK